MRTITTRIIPALLLAAALSGLGAGVASAQEFTPRRLDFDDVSASQCHQIGGVGPVVDLRQVEYANTFERV